MSQLIKPSAEAIGRDLQIRGYCVLPGFLQQSQIDKLARICTEVRERTETASFSRDRYSGLVTDVIDAPELWRCIAWRRPYSLLRTMGYCDPKWFMGFIIQKPPGGKRLYWHQDWWGWTDAVSYVARPPLLFFMYYLADAGPSNGCLRVLPGSHLTEHPIHHAISEVTDFLSLRIDDNHPLLADIEGEEDVPVRSGDLIIRDSRLLHSTHTNSSGEWRPLVLMSIVPEMRLLPEPMQRTIEIKRPKIERHWPAQASRQIADKIASYTGNASPLVIHRTPNYVGSQHGLR